MQPLCLTSDIAEGDARGFSLDGIDLIVVKKQGVLYVYRNRCPHRGINLEWMPDRFLDPQRELLQCATHGALFQIENGQCVQGPCLGEWLESVASRVEGDRLLITLPVNSDRPAEGAPAE